jgi:hypothetical protein
MGSTTIGTLAGMQYNAEFDEASSFVSISTAVDLLFSIYVSRFFKTGPQQALYFLTAHVAATVAGMLATKIFCQKMITLRQAFAARSGVYMSYQILFMAFPCGCTQSKQ